MLHGGAHSDSRAANTGRVATTTTTNNRPTDYSGITSRHIKDYRFHLQKPQIVVFLVVSILSTTMANENAKAVTLANNQFTNRLYSELAKEPGNVFFSPISAHTILSLVYQGAEGSSEQALRTGLGISDKVKSADGYSSIMKEINGIENVTLEMANRVYVMDNYKLNENFRKVAMESFLSDAVNVNFAENVGAAKAINGWVEDKTKNKIKDLIQSSDLNGDTRMVLVNAIYFKGAWLDKFQEAATTDDQFYINENDTVPCKMMHATRKYGYAEIADLDAQVLRMPYKNENVQMVIILPKQRNGIAALEEKLKTFDLNSINGQLRQEEVVLSLPRFKVEVTIPLNEPLKKLGMENIFSTQANFSGLLDSPEQLQVSKVVQKAFIEVNEEGAEAAAATGMIFRPPIPGPPRLPTRFIADHTFIYYIQHQENILFIGKLARPN